MPLSDPGPRPAPPDLLQVLACAPVPIGGDLTYRIDPQWISVGSSRVATPHTYVEFEGRTANGDDSTMPFHVTSADWQESDRLLAGLMTAFGAPEGAAPTVQQPRSCAPLVHVPPIRAPSPPTRAASR